MTPRIYTPETGWGTVHCTASNLDGPMIFVVWDGPAQGGFFPAVDLLNNPGHVIQGASDLIRLVGEAPGVGAGPLYVRDLVAA